MIERLAPLARGGDGDVEVRFDLLLADVLAQPPRPQRQLDGGVVFERDRGESLVGHDGSLSADDADERRYG